MFLTAVHQLLVRVAILLLLPLVVDAIEPNDRLLILSR